MSRNRRRYTEQITYWAPAAANSYGEESFAAPATLAGRWEDKQEKVTIPSGEVIVSKAYVYSEANLLINGYVVRGASTQTDPTKVPGAEQILGKLSVQSLRTNTEVKAAIL